MTHDSRWPIANKSNIEIDSTFKIQEGMKPDTSRKHTLGHETRLFTQA